MNSLLSFVKSRLLSGASDAEQVVDEAIKADFPIFIPILMIVAAVLLLLILFYLLWNGWQKQKRRATRPQRREAILAENPAILHEEPVPSVPEPEPPQVTIPLTKQAKEVTIRLDKPAIKAKEHPATDSPVGDVRYRVGSAMHPGTRTSQQDALYVANPADMKPGGMLLGVLCDGMGGMERGEEASQMAVEAMRRDFEALSNDADIPAFLEKEAHALDQLVHDTLSTGEPGGSSGSTLVSVVVRDNLLYWLSVGDSRIYIARGNEIVQVTRDHNLRLMLEEKVETGEMTEEMIENTREKNALISYLGMGGLEIVDVNKQPFTLVSGDIILLCSDGLTNALSTAQIQHFLREEIGNMVICARNLTHKAFELRKDFHQDNTSVIVIHYCA